MYSQRKNSRRLLLVFLIEFACAGHVRKGVARSDDDLGPTISVRSPYLIVSSNSTFSITCEGYHPIRWNSTIDMDVDQRAVIHERSMFKGYKSTLTVVGVVVQDTGTFSCYYAANDTGTNARATSVYVYVTDPNHLLVPLNSYYENHDLTIVVMQEGRKGLIPCRPTHPAVNMSLIKFPEPQVHLEPNDVEFNSMQGFIIKFPNVFFTDLFECKATLGRITEQLSFHLMWLTGDERPPRPYIDNKIINFKEGIFKLTCSINIDPNFSLHMKWVHPNPENPRIQISPFERTTIFSANGYQFVNLKSTLTLTKIASTDGGRYACRAIGVNGHFEEDFVYMPVETPARIVSSNLDGTVLAAELDLELKLMCVADGYPKPTLQWFKNGNSIDETSDRRYRIINHQFKLIIDDVMPSDVGEYSCVTYNRLGSESRNVTVTLLDSSTHWQHQISSSVAGVADVTFVFFATALICALLLTTS